MVEGLLDCAVKVYFVSYFLFIQVHEWLQTPESAAERPDVFSVTSPFLGGGLPELRI